MASDWVFQDNSGFSFSDTDAVVWAKDGYMESDDPLFICRACNISFLQDPVLTLDFNCCPRCGVEMTRG